MKSILGLMILSLFLGTGQLQAKEQIRRIVVSVGDLKENNNKEWKRHICGQVYNIAKEVLYSGVEVTCRQFSTENFVDPGLDRLKPMNDFHVRVIREQDDKLGVDVTNWHRKNDSDFKSLGWNFKKDESGKISQADAFNKALTNFFFYVANEKAYKAGLLMNGVAESDEVDFDEKNQTFIDKLSNRPITIERAYTLFENESSRKKNYLRTGVELGVLLSSAMAIYYKNLVMMKQDFDYGFKDGVKKKLNGEAWLFDDNDKASNYGHELAGVMYYQVARSNGFNALESFLITQASSAVWEFMEYHEVFSINDQILTPIGGYVIGEATYQISCALVQKNSIAAKSLGYVINPNMAVNHALDAGFKKDKYHAQPDCKKPRWSDISMQIGLEKNQKPYNPGENKTANVALNAEVINLSGYGKEGSDSKLVLDSSISKMFVELNGNQGTTDLAVIAQVVMAAYHQKEIHRDERGLLRGYDVVFGLGSSSTYRDRGAGEDSDHDEFFGTVGIIGANAHANIHYKGFNIRADFAIYGDFSMVKAMAIEPSGDMNDQPGVMKKRGYYWGYGSTSIASIAVEYGKVTVGYSGQFSSAKSINSRHRIDGSSPDDFRDSVFVNRVSIEYALTKRVSLQLAYEEINRKGNNDTKNIHYSGKEKRFLSSIKYVF